MRLVQLVLPAIVFAICKAHILTGDFVGDAPSMDSADDLRTAQLLRNLDMQQRREQLIGQYRFLIAKSLLRLKDACKVYDLFMLDSDPGSMVGQDEREPRSNNGRGQPIDTERYINSVLTELQSQSIDEIKATFARQNSSDPAINVLFYFVTTSAMLKDPRLDTLLAAMLYDQCCSPGDPNAPCREESMPKRDHNAPPKKARFHSWGGKRSSSSPAKVVIRTPFHSWGGK